MKNHVAELRDKVGMSQGELARITECSRQWLSGVEIGRVNPSLPLALRIAHTLNQPVESIFELEPSDRPSTR